MGLARSLSVAIPAHNEEKNLEGAVLDTIAAAQMFDDFEIIIVNDGSQDGTGLVADRLAAEHERVRVIHHNPNRGFAGAYQSGLEQARMAYFTFVPGDHEVRPESVRLIFETIGRADLVVPYHGAPWNRTLFRRVLTFVSTTEINLLFGRWLKYYQGPVVYPTGLARSLPITTRGFFFCTEMLLNALAMGYTFVEVPLVHQERAYGVSKAVKISNIINAELTILRLWWHLRIKKAIALRPASLGPTALGDEPRPAFDAQ
jgi:glycosyltransferase involved in cell wall biosynthesis